MEPNDLYGFDIDFDIGGRDKIFLIVLFRGYDDFYYLRAN